MTAPNLAIPLRQAIIGASSTVSLLAAYNGSYPVFTRRPVPDDAPYPMIVVGPDVSASNEDGLSDNRPVLLRDIMVYGKNDTPDNYRNVEVIAYAIRELFHHQRNSITVEGWSVIGISADGPLPAPTDDDQTVGRMIAVTVRLAAR